CLRYAALSIGFDALRDPVEALADLQDPSLAPPLFPFCKAVCSLIMFAFEGDGIAVPARRLIPRPFDAGDMLIDDPLRHQRTGDVRPHVDQQHDERTDKMDLIAHRILDEPSAGAQLFARFSVEIQIEYIHIYTHILSPAFMIRPGYIPVRLGTIRTNLRAVLASFVHR